MLVLWRLLDLLIDALALIACLLICLLTGSVALGVILRALNIGNIPWALEGSEYMLYGVTFLGAPWVLRSGGHVSVDVFVRNLPNAAARALGVVSDLCGAFVAVVLVYYGSRVTAQSYSENVIIFKTLVFPEWWILWLMPMTALCILGEFIRRLVHSASPATEGH